MMAVSHLEIANRLQPNDPRILNNLGMVREKVAQSDAVEDFRRALALDVRSATAAMNLARVLTSIARHSEAIRVLEEALNTVGDDTDVRILLASICAEANRTGEAVVHYEKAAAAEPHSTRSLVALGNLHRQIGQFEKAHAYYQRALEVDPQDLGALVGILKHLKSGVPEHEMERIAARANDTTLPPERRRQLHFALSQCREEAGEFDAAFEQMKEETCFVAWNWSRRADPTTPTRELLLPTARWKSSTSYFRRVADFGVPTTYRCSLSNARSGTTLCEQILASHSRIFGADELPDMGRIANGLQREFVKRTGRTDELGFVAQLTRMLSVRSQSNISIA